MYEISRTALASMDLSCPVCGGTATLKKRVNEEHDEIWICTECPAVLFAFWQSAQIRRLSKVLGVPTDDPGSTALR